MPNDPLTYAKAGGPPANWMQLQVRDLKTGDLVKEVVEVNTAEGWLRRNKQERGEPMVRDGKIVTERIRGRFAIEEIGK